MKKLLTRLTLALAVTFATAGFAAAETIPLAPLNFGNLGSLGANYYAPGGPLMAYYAGAGADDTNHAFLGSLPLFKNRGAGANQIGDSVALGSFDAGTKLVFRLEDQTTGKTYSTGMWNAMVQPFAGGTFKGFSFPSGFLIRFEDRSLLKSDWDFNDMAFVVAPAPAAVPEPATMALLGTGLAAGAAWRRRRNKKLAQ